MAVSGIATATVATGAVVLYAGLTDQSITNALRGVLRGELKPVTNKPAQFQPSGSPSTVEPAGSAVGSLIASAGLAYVGRPYAWAKNFDPPNGGGDCSGLVYRAYRDSGIVAPRLNALGFSQWRTRRVTSPSRGDLVWYPGHIAIAVSGTDMVEAPTFGVPVHVVPIRRGGMYVRYQPPSTPAKGRAAV